MKKETKQEKTPRLFDQIFFESENLKLTRHKVSETMRKVGDWFNKEFSQAEPLPPEFKNLDIRNEYERARDVWQKHF